MDVEKRTVISAGMDASGVTSGMQSVTSDAAKMAAGVTQSVSQVSRALLDSKAGFDALAKNFVDGYRNAQNFAQAVQTAYRSLGTGELGQVRDKLGLLPQILDNISAKYGVFGEAARQAALKMIDATATQAQRLQAFQSLIASAGGQAAPTSSAVPGVAPNVAIVEAYSTALTNLQAKYSPLAAAAQTYQASLAGIASAEMVGVDAANARSAASIPYLRAQAAEAAGMDSLRASFDPLYRVSKQYEQELEFVRLASSRLGQSQAQTEANLALVTASFAAANAPLQRHGTTLDSVTGSTWNQQFAMRQLGVQSIQTVTSIASGLPIWMTLIQQGHQVLDVSLSAGVGFRALAAGVWELTKALLANPTTLFIIGIVALTTALVTLVAHAQTAAQRIGDLQNQFRASRGDAEAMAAQTEAAARHLAQTTSLGFTEASKAAAEFAKNPAFQGTQQQQEALVNQAHRLQLVLGGDLPAATKILARGMDDAAAAAQTLLDEHHFGAADGVTQAWVNSLKEMNQAQAFQALSDKIAQVTRDARDRFTNLGEAWKDFQKLVSGGGPGVWTDIGNNIADGLAAVLRAINAIIEKWQELKALIGTGDDAREQLKKQGGAIIGGSTVQQQLKQWSLDTFYGGGSSTGADSERERALADIAKRESGNRNVPNQMGPGGTPLSTASGHYQILDSTWREGARLAGVDIERLKYPTAMSAPFDVQHQVAGALYDRYGATPWASSAPTNRAGTGDTVQQISKAAEAATADALSARMTENLKKQQDATDGLRQAQEAMKSAVAGTPEFDLAARNVTRYSEGLDILKGRATDIISEQEKLARSATDAVRPLNAQAGAARSLAEIENQFRIAARSANGGIVDQTALNTALSAKQQELTNTANDHVRAMDRQTNMTNALTTATEQGGAALDHARNFEQALIDVQATATAGTDEYKRQVVALTEALDRGSDAKRTNVAATDIGAMNKEQEMLAAEARLIGESTMAREQELAVIRRRQSYSLAAGDPGNAKQQEAIEQSRMVAGQKVQNKELEVNYNELANATSQSFQTIGDAIAQAFVSGEGAAVSFQNVLKAVISQVIQEMIKLSIINPILNSLFPGTEERPTATGVLGSIFRGVGAVAGGGGIDSGSWDVGFAKGGVFSGSPSLSAFSNSIVSSPTLFDTGLSGFRAYAQGGTGMMGEAGSEAIIPLVRGPDGNLGVRGGGGGGGTSVVVNTPITINGGGGQQSGKPMDPQALKQLQQQIDQTVRHAVRTTIVDERRPGGDLFFR